MTCRLFSGYHFGNEILRGKTKRKDVTGTYQASYALMSGFALLVALAMLILARWRG